MTPQEFKDQYQEAQERLGDRLQTLTDLSYQVQVMLEQVSQDYKNLNALAEAFFSQQGIMDSPPHSEPR